MLLLPFIVFKGLRFISEYQRICDHILVCAESLVTLSLEDCDCLVHLLPMGPGTGKKHGVRMEEK